MYMRVGYVLNRVFGRKDLTDFYDFGILNKK